MITTAASLEGTLSEGPTTILTNTPDIVTNPELTTSSFSSTSNIETTTKVQTESSTPFVTTNTVSSTHNAQTTISQTNPVNPIITGSTSILTTKSNFDTLVTTIVTGSLVTKTYIVTTSSALVLLVTETKTTTNVETSTIAIQFVDYFTSNTIYPVETVTSSSMIFGGYYNISSVLYDKYYSTLYKTDYVEYKYTSSYFNYEYFTYTKKEIVTSAFIVYNPQILDSYSISTGYNTIVSTLYPTKYISTLTSDNHISITTPIEPTSSIEQITITSTTTQTQIQIITVTPTITGTCDINQTKNATVFIDSIFTGQAVKVETKTFAKLMLIILLFMQEWI